MTNTGKVYFHVPVKILRDILIMPFLQATWLADCV